MTAAATRAIVAKIASSTSSRDDRGQEGAEERADGHAQPDDDEQGAVDPAVARGARVPLTGRRR